MKTLIIISHPELTESYTQQFLKESLPEENVTWHHLEAVYPDEIINVKNEQALLREHDRIIFQFPFYWYSSPSLFKKWQDLVLIEGFAHGKKGQFLKNKECQLVVTTGVNINAYQPGASEQFTIPELLRPFQATIQKCHMTYLPPLVIARFDYMSETEKKALLIDYRQALTNVKLPSLKEKEEWFKQELNGLGKEGFSTENQHLVDLLIAQMEENREQLDDLNWTLEEMKE